jgi:hypothetical protein
VIVAGLFRRQVRRCQPNRPGRKKSPVQAPYDTDVTADVFAEARNTFNCLIGQLTDAHSASLTHDQLEETLVEQGRELQRQLLQAHLDLRALRERQQVYRARHDGVALGVTGADGVVRRQVERGHHRLLATVVGTVTVTRCAWRAPNVRNAYPADAVLSLPAVRHSAGLAKLAVIEAVRGSFDTAHAALTARCGNVIGKRQIEQLVAQAAADVDAFYAARQPPSSPSARPAVPPASGRVRFRGSGVPRRGCGRACYPPMAAGGHGPAVRSLRAGQSCGLR